MSGAVRAAVAASRTALALVRRRAMCALLPALVAGMVLPGHAAPAAETTRGVPAATLLAADELPPPEPREFRAAWVASVANIDWPSRPGLPTAKQQAEALAILERARAVGLNAIVLQVRPAGDALYASRLEPWSEYLTGRQGRAPRPWWDPLAFWVHEAHRRGLQLHAWFNPLRARHPSAKTPLVRPHLALRAPASVKAYGELLWMNPADAVARVHTLAVIEDVLRRYDIDGVHIDDYFYPYPVGLPDGSDLVFPDDGVYRRYLGEGGTLPLPDWRRAQVDSLVLSLFERVRRTRPQALFGISPFGLGRPDRRPPGVGGFSQVDKLFADVERWLEMGWLDYLAPQLYWPLASETRPFALLLQSWAQANVRGRHLWPGLFTSSVRSGAAAVGGEAPGLGATRTWPASEVLAQVALLRQAGSGASGHIHFSMAALMHDRDGIATQLQRDAYTSPALVPATPWLDAQSPPPPRLLRRGDFVAVTPGPGEAAALFAVWRRVEGRWRFAVVPAGTRRLARDRADAVVVAAVDRRGNVSERQALRWP